MENDEALLPYLTDENTVHLISVEICVNIKSKMRISV